MYLNNVCINVEDRNKEVYDKYKIIMECIINRSLFMAINEMESIKRQVQSKIGSREENIANGMLNKRLDTLQCEVYRKLCIENNIPSQVEELFFQRLISYQKD